MNLNKVKIPLMHVKTSNFFNLLPFRKNLKFIYKLYKLFSIPVNTVDISNFYTMNMTPEFEV